MLYYRLIFFLVCVVVLAGCNNFERNAYNSLVVAGESYDAVMRSIAEAHADGFLDKSQYDSAKAIARIYRGAFHAARVALEEYIANPLESERLRVHTTLRAMTERLGELLEYAREIGVGVQQLQHDTKEVAYV